jgi:hypothetical protein
MLARHRDYPFTFFPFSPGGSLNASLYFAPRIDLQEMIPARFGFAAAYTGVQKVQATHSRRVPALVQKNLPFLLWKLEKIDLLCIGRKTYRLRFED